MINSKYIKNRKVKDNRKIRPIAMPTEKSGLHIAMFTNNYLPFIGGVPLSIDRMASEFRKQGHRVFLFAPEYPTNNFKDHEDTIRCKLIKYTKGFPFYYAVCNIFSPHIEEIFTKLDIDVIHIHHPYWMGNKGIQMGKKYKIPIVYTYHTRFDKYIGNIPYMNEKIGKCLSNYFISHTSSHCSCIFAPSESAKEYLEKVNVTIPIEVIPTGIELSHYNIKSTEEDKIRNKYLGSGDILLFSVSRLSKEKNLYFLLDGLRYVKQNTSIRFKCIIAGDGYEKENLENYLIENKMNNDIYLLGTIPPQEINYYYKASDIFVFSSTSETQGIVLLEAMAASLPVVAISSPGVDDVIQNNVNGFKTNNDIKEWGDKLIRLMENSTLLEAMSMNAYNIATMYSIENTSKKALCIYNELVSKKNKYLS